MASSVTIIPERHVRLQLQVPPLTLQGCARNYFALLSNILDMTFPSEPQQECRPIQDFIDKPVAIPELLRRVEDVLRSHTYTPCATP